MSSIKRFICNTILSVLFLTGGSTPCNHGAAVAALKGRGVGLVRLVQTSEEECLIEATIDGLSIEQHEIKIHEYGDLADGGDRY